MKYIITFLLICSCFASFAQRLFLHHIPSGNYQSYDLGDKINLILFDSSTNIVGQITALTKDEIVINDTSVVKLSQVAGILTYRGGAKVGRVLLVVLGSYLIVSGVINTIVGLAVIPIEPQLGIAVVVVGAGMGVGGYAIVKKQSQKMKERGISVKNIDQAEYRLFIEN